MLEAGCGSISYLTFPPDSYLVGIDISDAQLRKNTYLDEKILGDIESHDLPADDFDVIVCWNVFEYLPHPERALFRFVPIRQRHARAQCIFIFQEPPLHT